MPNQIGLSGGQPQKQTRFAPLYTGRWSSGLWTNRSPLRDGNTSRIVEKFYGAAGDALIDGLNVEITNRLTLARRPGNPVFDSNTYTGVDNIQAFSMFSPTTEQIDVMIDEANQLSSLFGGVKSLVWNKSVGAGQTYMQPVGNSLYFANGIDNKKWLQSLVTWAASTQWNGPTSPYMTTFLIDSNGNIQQLTACIIGITSTTVASGVLTVTATETLQPGGLLSDLVTPGLQVKFPAALAATTLQGLIVTVDTVSGLTFTAKVTLANYASTPETAKTMNVFGGFPVSGVGVPTWSTTPLTPGMATPSDALTLDGTVQWTNRGTPVENWGIKPPTTTMPKPGLNSSRVAWNTNTFYSNPGVIIDANGNIQLVTIDGISGASVPTWGTNVNDLTVDGGVTWKLIQKAPLGWAAGTAYTPGVFVTGATAGTGTCLFRLRAFSQPLLKNGNIDVWTWNHDHSRGVGSFALLAPVVAGVSNAGTHTTTNTYVGHATVNCISKTTPVSSSPGNGDDGFWDQQSNAGEWVSNSRIYAPHADTSSVISGTLTVGVPGQYTFALNHHDGCFIGFGGGATKVSGVLIDDAAVSPARTTTAMFGYPIFGGTDTGLSGNAIWNDTVTVNFPVAGDYPFEIDYAYWYHSSSHTEQPVMKGAPNSEVYMEMVCNGKTIIPTTPVSGATQPIWPDWTTAFAAYDSTANDTKYPTVTDASGTMVWENLGPVTDYVWVATTTFTLPNQIIIDPNGNQQAPYRTGVTGSDASTEPSVWATGIGQLTNDNPNLIWICHGGASSSALGGTLSTFSDQGWEYCIALVNTLDNTVSNCGKLSVGTGKIIGAKSLNFAAGDGLPPASQIDPQVDYVAIFRTTDGLGVPFLIPGLENNTFYTISLAEYLANGYSDTTPDTSLDNLIQGPISGENTPPAGGAQNLTYHLNRIFFSVGNVVYWTSGPDDPIGNGLNGVSPLNFDQLPSLVKRIVPTGLGALVFTVSDIFIINGTGTSNNPIQSAQPFISGIGLLSYNALALKGTTIGMFTTDKQFLILDPTSGVSIAGFPIGDRLRKNNGQPGTAWNPKNVYVTWHANGEDHAWYLSDGANGWYKLIDTPAPEDPGHYTWSPFANIVGGCKAVLSIEVSPGVHELLLGPTGSGEILHRDLTTFTDGASSTYGAWAVIGSAVLAQPGQVAEVMFITTESVRTGTSLTLGILVDEALPYYTGPFEILKVWEDDPTGIPPSRSIFGQRFYMSESKDKPAICRHMQFQINWVKEEVASELLTLTVFGAYNQES